MNRERLIRLMAIKGKTVEPLEVFLPSHNTILGVYQGYISEFDILIRYKQKLNNGRWSRIRTPKHIHWAVDLLIKMHYKEKEAKKFLDFLLDIWEKTKPLKSQQQRRNTLKIEKLILSHKNEIEKYEVLSGYGEYNIEFLILLAKLLMLQEKTNREDAYLFKNLLTKLKNYEGIYSIISAASFGGNKG